MLWTFSGRGGGVQPHSIAFGGLFPNITEAILIDEISKKTRVSFFGDIYQFKCWVITFRGQDLAFYAIFMIL